jgi:hypothetical protein
MKRIWFSILLASTLIIGVLPTAHAVVTPGSKCSKAGAKQTYKGNLYTCIKLGQKLYWNNGTRITTPKPSISSPGIPAQKKITSGDIQFIYGTASRCRGHIGFLRFDPKGSLIVDRKIVETDNKFEITPLDYNDDELLFSTNECNSGGKLGSVETIWRLNLLSPNSTPKEVYKIAYQGTRNGILMDAKFDIASSKVLIFAWVGGDQQIFTAETQPLTIWSSSRQGWLSAGITGTAMSVSTGWSLSVYGYSLGNSTWRSVYVDWRTEIPGIGSVTPRGFGSNAQFQGRGAVNQVSTGILDMPYIFTTDDGLYACIDYPTSSGPLVNVGTSERCTRVSGSQLGEVGLTFAESGSRKSSQGIISIADGKVYIFESGPIFGQWNPIQITKTVDISAPLRRIPVIYDVISTFQVSTDLNQTSPKLKYVGFFSSN